MSSYDYADEQEDCFVSSVTVIAASDKASVALRSKKAQSDFLERLRMRSGGNMTLAEDTLVKWWPYAKG